jgi:hypothetical protein
MLFSKYLLLALLWIALAGAGEADKLENNLPEDVAKAWKEFVPPAKLLTVKSDKEKVSLEASDALNEKLSLVFSTTGELLSQSPRKLELKSLPKGIPPGELLKTGKWNEVVISEKKPDDAKLLYTLTGSVLGMQRRLTINSAGLVVSFTRILTAEQEKAEAEAKAKEPPPRRLELKVGQNGRVIYKGKYITDDELKELVEKEGEREKLKVEISTSLKSVDRMMEITTLLGRTGKLKVMEVHPIEQDPQPDKPEAKP